MDITVQELRQKFESGDEFVFIDVREPWEYEEFNIGAKLIPLSTLMPNLAELENHKEDEIVVHCRSGARSATAQALMTANGFTNVRNMTGGIMAWMQAYGKEQP
ncbi:MAG: rhodanese-like domain-containing protein [Bacteroidota bacterium]